MIFYTLRIHQSFFRLLWYHKRFSFDYSTHLFFIAVLIDVLLKITVVCLEKRNDEVKSLDSLFFYIPVVVPIAIDSAVILSVDSYMHVGNFSTPQEKEELRSRP